MNPIFDHTLLKLIQVAISLFAGVLFLQSGFDKVIDFSGNKSYIQSVFAKTFLRSVSTMLFIVILILEVSAGIFSFLGGVYYFAEGQADFAVLGLEVSTLAILCLFTGQRIAKDYAGAASLVGYFLLMVFGIYLFSLHG
ncbi:DoxX family protein [Emticicia sp. 21SJ11W-3]|uniref:DoxX family protein n=1 Tax=Emticicia sp. 21SJ11W-3 TaxID=2916755 RepID=UPI00209E9DDC|nr:DoxX family protein [Emticicia sp. 21SJ11W-3]UTA68599.1 DoxX family protein [Emticicia sp. 21SJ11W-3]